MRTPYAEVLGLLYFLSEALLAVAKRSREGSVSRDRGSLRLLWVVILVSIGLAHAAAYAVPQADSLLLHRLRHAGLALVVLGLALRWYAILHLGRFFTVNVAIAQGQRVVETGPYALVRHPSYAGALAAFLGLGICTENWLALGALVLPITAAFLRRMAIEEAALLEAFGEDYRAYCGRTKRLLPRVF
jgi:protein-S-isoprenylcysteine O-methyltransferase